MTTQAATEPEVDPTTAWSESGFGWTNDGLYPFFPGMPCVHCGRFVGRDGIFNVEHFEMSTEIASVDAEHRNCTPRGVVSDGRIALLVGDHPRARGGQVALHD